MNVSQVLIIGKRSSDCTNCNAIGDEVIGPEVNDSYGIHFANARKIKCILFIHMVYKNIINPKIIFKMYTFLSKVKEQSAFAYTYTFLCCIYFDSIKFRNFLITFFS